MATPLTNYGGTQTLQDVTEERVKIQSRLEGGGGQWEDPSSMYQFGSTTDGEFTALPGDHDPAIGLPTRNFLNLPIKGSEGWEDEATNWSDLNPEQVQQLYNTTDSEIQSHWRDRIQWDEGVTFDQNGNVIYGGPTQGTESLYGDIDWMNVADEDLGRTFLEASEYYDDRNRLAGLTAFEDSWDITSQGYAAAAGAMDDAEARSLRNAQQDWGVQSRRASASMGNRGFGGSTIAQSYGMSGDLANLSNQADISGAFGLERANMELGQAQSLVGLLTGSGIGGSGGMGSAAAFNMMQGYGQSGVGQENPNLGTSGVGAAAGGLIGSIGGGAVGGSVLAGAGMGAFGGPVGMVIGGLAGAFLGDEIESWI